MGVLETTVPMRTWKTPYSMFLLSVSGKPLRHQGRPREHRCECHRRALHAVPHHPRSQACPLPVIPRSALERCDEADGARRLWRCCLPRCCLLAFSASNSTRATPGSVGIGVMDYCGRNVDRRQADDIRSSYIAKITEFALWLVDNGRPIRLITSDPVADDRIIRAILESLEAQRPGTEPVAGHRRADHLYR